MLETLSSLLWGWHVLGLILAAGVHFSLSTAFFQVRCFFTWMRASPVSYTHLTLPTT